MSDATDYPRYPRHHRDALARLRAWAFSRPAESWLFFAAGLIVGSLVG